MFWKRIVPGAWICVMGLGAIASLFRIKDDPTFFLVWICGVAGTSAALLWLASRLKIVYIDDSSLLVSDGRRAVTIPLAQIADVRETMVWNPKQITIDLKSASDFGRKVVFIPTEGHFFNALDRHPIVGELKALIQEADSSKATAN